jgi:hypothetical protein
VIDLAEDILGVILFLAVFIFPPIIFTWTEFSKRRKYPIRVDLVWQQGHDASNAKWVSKSDRVGFVQQKNAEGKDKGLFEWRLHKANRPVMGFDYRYVYEKTIWFGLKKVQFATVYGLMGENGEEFRPMAFNSAKGESRPIFEGERAILFQRMTEDFMARSAISNWLKDNLLRLAEIGGLIFIVIMLFWNGLQLGENAKVLAAGIQANQPAGEKAQEQPQQQTQKATEGLPFLWGGQQNK